MKKLIKPVSLAHTVLLIVFLLCTPALRASLFQTNDAITVGPVIAGSQLLFGDGAGWLYSINLRTGKQVWRRHLPAKLTEISICGNYLAASTYVEGKPEYNRAYILTVDSGKFLWALGLGEERLHNPVLTGDRLVVWSQKHPAVIRSYPVTGGASYVEKLLPNDEWIGLYSPRDSRLILLGANNGLQVFSLPSIEELWHRQSYARNIAGILTSGDIVLDNCEASSHCVVTAEGRPYPWRWPLTTEIAGVTESGMQLIIAEYGATVHALARDTGKVLWQFHVDGTNDAQAVVAGGGKFFFHGGNQGIFALDATNGHLLWKFPVHRDNWNIVYQNDRLYFADEQYQLNSVDANTGQLLWAKALGHRPTGATPLVAEGSAIMATLDGRVISFSADSGKRQWEFRSRANVKYRKSLRGKNQDSLQISGNGV